MNLYSMSKKVLMVQPIAFACNEETIVNNHFQDSTVCNEQIVQQKALAEFKAYENMLQDMGVDVFVLEDTPDPHTPDSIFPNNWVYFEEKKAVLFPMFAPNRRKERRHDLFSKLRESGTKITSIEDLSHFEEEGRYLEGTGSMVLDRERKMAYAALSPRTDKGVFEIFCARYGYRPFSFHAYQTKGSELLPIYHTNVMMAVGNNFAIICLESVKDEKEREALVDSLKSKNIINISEEQMNNFAGNVIQIRNITNESIVVISERAWNVLTKEQRDILSSTNRICMPSIPTIERYGGGGVRCMLAEIY